MQFRAAERKKAKLRLGLAGPSGSGKTLSALLVAYGITGDWSKIGLIDTESGSGELYAQTEKAGVPIGQYLTVTLEPPYLPQKYIEGIRAGEQAGLEVIILDSLSHAWAGEGGLLDQQGKIADKSGNSWTAWRTITPLHNQLVESILHSKCHIIATMRAKTEHVQTTDEKGKTVVKKLGMAPIQREGMDYEMTVMLDLDQNHVASTSKDRTGLFDGQYFKPTPETGEALLAWLNSGVDAPAYEPPKEELPSTPQAVRATGKVNWSAFWGEARKLGFDRDAVHKAAGVESIQGWTQEQIDALLATLKTRKGAA